MKFLQIQVIETVIVVFIYIVLFFLFKTLINNYLKNTRIDGGRRKMALRAIQLFITTAAVIILTGIWGFEQSQIALFASSILTALGIAFFAQWSLLSNITSSILIFFNHPVKLGDYVKGLSKEYHYEGTVVEMNYFFVHVKSSQDEIITIPNSHFFSSSFSIKERKDNK